MPFSEFKRSSLAARVAQVLCDSIHRNELANPLPGEHHLAESLGVSRPTLRRALAILAHDGVVEISKGRRTRIIQQTGNAGAGPAKRVCGIGSMTAPEQNIWLQQIRLRLTEEGVIWNEYFDKKLSIKKLKELVTNRPNTCWVLLRASPEIQAFFSNSSYPALILGSSYPGMSLPSFDWDYNTTGQHAAHLLINSGARQIALIQPADMMAGDWATRQGFEEAIKAKSGVIKLSEITVHNERVEIQAVCKRLFSGSRRPDAIFVSYPTLATAVLTQALLHGINVPGDLRILCRDDHPFFESVFPAMDHYAISESRFLHSALRLIHALLEGQTLEKKPHFIIPEYIKGETVRPSDR